MNIKILSMSSSAKWRTIAKDLSVRCKIIHRSECRMYSKSLTVDNMNPKMIQLEYAVRGPVAMRCIEIESELNEGVCSRPFQAVTKAHVGEPQAMGQKPLTYFRQVFACILYPSLMDTNEFPSDVKERAKEILSQCVGGSIGSYTSPVGLESVRKRCAEYMHKRDGVPASWEDVWMSAGASTGIRNVLKLFINKLDGKPSSIMIPIPQYPLYSATLTEYGIEQAHYYLDEDKNWALNVEELERSIEHARHTTAVRAIVVINPGNPTGQVLTRKNLEEIIKFAHKHNLFILADEVYQENVYAAGSKFFSVKKVLTEMGPPYSSVELASFMSCSKGYVGECGFRGGYVEFVNLDPIVMEYLYKACSSGCPTTLGQACMDLVARPPQPGEESYVLFCEEKRNILESLRQRAQLATDTFNQMDGFTCNVVQGAMYAFPKITLPPKAVEKARAEGKAPDVYYAFSLLEETGICVVPGSGFGQKSGTHHFRTTILPQPDRLHTMMHSFKQFHHKFTLEHT